MWVRDWTRIRLAHSRRAGRHRSTRSGHLQQRAYANARVCVRKDARMAHVLRVGLQILYASAIGTAAVRTIRSACGRACVPCARRLRCIQVCVCVCVRACE